MNGASQKRILKEYNEITKSTDSLPPGTQVKMTDEADIYHWEVHMEAPENSVYAGGHYILNITLPKDYPFRPPVINFVTKIYHPNVSNDGKGSMCLGILRSENWKPPCKIVAVLQLVHDLLIQPNVDDAVEPSIANEMSTDRKAFEKTVKDWVTRYAEKK